MNQLTNLNSSQKLLGLWSLWFYLQWIFHNTPHGFWRFWRFMVVHLSGIDRRYAGANQLLSSKQKGGMIGLLGPHQESLDFAGYFPVTILLASEGNPHLKKWHNCITEVAWQHYFLDKTLMNWVTKPWSFAPKWEGYRSMLAMWWHNFWVTSEVHTAEQKHIQQRASWSPQQ